MNPYRTPSRREVEPSPATSCDGRALVSFAAALAVVVAAIVAVGFMWGADVAGLCATFVTPPFIGLACDENEP